MFNILIICTANVCRSPAAEIILARLLKDRQATASSCGTRAIGGQPADPFMQMLAKDRGWGDMGNFRSRPLMPSTTHGQDLVLCMGKNHIDYVLSMSPILRGRVKLFGHWQGLDINDPVGKDKKDYESCMLEMEVAAKSWIDNLHRMGVI